jgi:hypothetical protein
MKKENSNSTRGEKDNCRLETKTKDAIYDQRESELKKGIPNQGLPPVKAED